MTKEQTIQYWIEAINNPEIKNLRQALTDCFERGYRAGFRAADDNPRQPESMGR